MKFRLFSIIISIQVGLVITLSYRIYLQNKNILGITINPLHSNTIQKIPSGELKSFYEPKPGVIKGRVNDWVPLEATNTINKDSLNERFDYPVKKEVGVYRIITLGDSFTYGAFVDTKDNYTEMLEDKLNTLHCKNIKKFEVINLGMDGYDMRYALERFIKRGVKYNPDLVLWFIIQGDLQKNDELYTKIAGEVMDEQKKTGTFESQIQNGNYYPYVSETLKRMYVKMSKEDIIEYQYDSILQLKNYYKGNVVLFSYPSVEQRHKDKLLSITIQNNGWFYFNHITDTMNIPELSFVNDGHPNQEGHKAIAGDLEQYLTKNNTLICN